MARIAFVGLGTMGAPIARHLVAAGHDLVGYDVDPARTPAAGLDPAGSPAAAVAEAELALTSLPDPEAVREVWLGADGLATGARPGTLLVDLSTGSPALARELAATLEPTGLDVLDAPVSGGPHGARDATLTVMVGGREEPFARAHPILTAFGRHVVLVGGHGAGQTAKLCNNLVAGVTMTAVAEACAIAEREGLDAATLFELMAASTGDSRVLRTRFPLAGAAPAHPSSRRWEPLFALDLLAKDLELAVELAVAAGVEPRVAVAALAEYRRAQADGHGHLDYSAVFLNTRSAD
ncbi:MAG: NAD(P)-dependent oxidoreductase [Thermoleophilia bacterium]|nr:NAD(P)-dependent oxidoreductase [Thermoleophilia bacterium]MDH4346292.1 NAD(P)-dependent oxidoreductase [Thermoleophilia bacterium]MDH5334066.1 NAD(P)-dependent oxidoreductase [Thermoleophilia bacterium]